MDDVGKLTISRIDEMKAERKTQAEPWWKDLSEVLIPRLQDLDGTKTMDALLAPGTYDSQGRSALEIMGNAVFSLMCGPSVDWISLGMFSNDDVMRDHASREYFDRLRMHALDALYENGFYENVKPAVEYAASLGTVATTVTAELEEDQINYLLWHPGDIYLRKGMDRRYGEVAIKQRVRYKDLLSYPDLDPKLEEKALKSPNEKLDIYYYINKTANDGTSVLYEFGMKYYVSHVTDGGIILHSSGLKMMPGSFWGFESDPRMDYGLSPGYHTLRDMLQSNKIRKLLLKETEQRVNPSLWIPEQGASQLYSEPGSSNYYTGDSSMFPRRIFEAGDVGLAFQIKEEINEIIQTRFYTKFFLSVMSKTHRRTAQEIAATQNEVGSQIAPLVYTVERNFLAPQIRRTIQILFDQGKLPEPSNKIKSTAKDFPLEVRFIGPLSMAQRYQYLTVKNTQMINDVLAPVYQLDPTALDNIDLNALVRQSALGLNGGYGIIRAEKDVEAIRAQRAQQQMQQQQMAMQVEAMKQPQAPESGSPAEAAMSE